MRANLDAITIGTIQLNSNVILAPMSGVTDLPFRRLVKKFGAGLVISEMVACRAMVVEHHKAMKKADIDFADTTNSCVQLAGCEPEVMAEAAKMNQDSGAKIIDINFGCPAKRVVNGYAGSSLMRDEKLATEIIKAVVSSVSIPVTVKMRTGWDDNSRNAPTLAKIAEQEGVQMITVHGRTRCQFYSGKSDWNFIKEVKDKISIPLIVNGDIKSYEDVDNALDLSCANGVMLGRGVYGKPWLLNQVDHYVKNKQHLPSPTLFEQKNIILNHYDDILSYYGIDNGIKIARKHLGWYSAGLCNSSDFRAGVNQETDHKKIMELIDVFYQNLIENQ
jgi:tRNA-dihydrouridine synthase B